MKSQSSTRVFTIGRAILYAGLVIGILDAIDAIIAFKIFAGFDPIPIYQFVASGLLGKEAFSGGIGAAALGLGIHFVIAFAAAAVYVYASQFMPVLKERWIPFGLAYGVAFYFLMNYAVIPMSRIEPSPFSLPLFLNGIFGHAMLVGLPAAYFAMRTASETSLSSSTAPTGVRH